MAFLYHRVPADFQGDTLYPLNRIKKIYPTIYDRAVKKYEGREGVMKRKIPILNCLWNDAVHLMPVHPYKIAKALRDLGYDKFQFQFFEIDSSVLDPNKTVIYTYEHALKKGVDESDFIPFRESLLPNYDVVAESTKNYYRENISEGNNFMLFFGLPHILTTKSINIEKAKIITTKNLDF